MDENEEYNPVEPNYYNYDATNILHLELPRESICYENIYICSYDINNDGCFPFLRFLLTNTTHNGNLMFPFVPLFANLNSEELINYTKVCLFGLLMLKEFDLFNAAIVFNGFYEYNHNLYMFFDITKLHIRIDDCCNSNNLWLTLMDEILNRKKLSDIVVDNSVVNFFTLNEKFCFLSDDDNNNFEIPVVCYVRKPDRKLNFTFIFGESTSDKNSMFGPFYYFTDFCTAFNGVLSNTHQIEYKKDVRPDDDKYGVVRFAVFAGKTKYIENNENDPPDESEIKAQRLQDDKLDQNMERLTIRITDHDGKWTQEYDSVYLGCIELDNGIIIDKPLLVVKNYKQQIPISYHYIN